MAKRKRRKSSNSGAMSGVIVAGLIILLAGIPKELWYAIAALVALSITVAAYYAYARHRELQNGARSTDQESVKQTATSTAAPRTSKSRVQPQAFNAQPLRDDEPITVTITATPVASIYRVPAAPKGFGTATWIPYGQAIEVAGITIPGGMIYFGTSLKTAFGADDPCLINPSKSVSSHGDYTERAMGYWPSYSEISGTARRAYLNWLADGRRDPEADIGYVFLFFYGLERRAIIDASKDPMVKAEWPSIEQEIRRLLKIYSEKSNSFRRYASELLDWISLTEPPTKLYQQPVPAFPKTFELPLYVRLALGQAAVDGAPVPTHLALSWAKLDPNISLRTPAIRCAEQFEKLFAQKYGATYGEGIVLPRNRTKLKMVYRPASAGFQGYGEIKRAFGDTPDITALTAPLKKLQLVVESTIKDLEPYSRYIGRNPDAKISLEGILHLPVILWPESTQKALQELKMRIGTGMAAMSFQNLLTTLANTTILTKNQTRTLAAALESEHIGMEPDILNGAKLPGPAEMVVLFAIPAGEPASSATPAYQVALLTLQLASGVATADGEFSASEIGHLREQVQSWTHLTPNHIRRLVAHLRLLVTTPVSLAALKKKLEPLEATSKEMIAVFMATVAQADGTVSPAEVKTLEKVYKALGVEPQKVFSDLHAVTSGTKASVATATEIEKTGFKLDPARIAALRQDTEKVSALLTSIFKEEEVAVTSVPEPEIEAEEEIEVPKSILGLDEPHTALARMLLSRPQWSREELLDVAADLDLMLDGAIEHINEAAFEAHDIPFTEGDDPIEVNAEVLEKIDA